MGADNRFKLILLFTLGVSWCSNLCPLISAEEGSWPQQEEQQSRVDLQQQNYPQNGFPGYVELVHSSSRHSKTGAFRSNGDNSESNYQQSMHGQQNTDNQQRRRSRINKDFARNVEIMGSGKMVPVVQAATNAPQQNNNQDKDEESGVIDKRKLLISNLDLFNGTDTKNLTDNQKLLLMQIADRVARYGENNLFRELAGVQQKHQQQQQQQQKEPTEQFLDSDATGDAAVPEGRASKNKMQSSQVKRPPGAVVATSSAGTKPGGTKRPNGTKTGTKTSKTKAKPMPVGPNFTPGPPLAPTPPSTHHLSTPSQHDSEKKSTTIASSRHTKKPIEDLIYDYNVTASALIESLSQPNPTAANNLLYQQTIHPAAATSTSSGSPGSSSSSSGQLSQQTATKVGQTSSSAKKPIKTGTAKPTKYHYYPHNQHIYLLPECATQQVCNAVYVRLNFTQPLCACPQRYRDPCSASLNEDDLHTTKLIGDKNRRAITLAKTCESISEMKECREPAEWSLLAVQNTRTGKSHYLVICRCSDKHKLEGPMSHDQPSYANLPGIRVFGMKCVNSDYAPPQRKKPGLQRYPAVQQQSRPTHKYSDSNYGYQQQHQSNYQYLNRPSPQSGGGQLAGQPSSVHFSGGYGRSQSLSSNETQSESEIKSSSADEEQQQAEGQQLRQEKSLGVTNNDDNDDDGDYDNEPEFPWHKVQELQSILQWNN